MITAGYDVYPMHRASVIHWEVRQKSVCMVQPDQQLCYKDLLSMLVWG